MIHMVVIVIVDFVIVLFRIATTATPTLSLFHGRILFMMMMVLNERGGTGIGHPVIIIIITSFDIGKETYTKDFIIPQHNIQG